MPEEEDVPGGWVQSVRGVTPWGHSLNPTPLLPLGGGFKLLVASPGVVAVFYRNHPFTLGGGSRLSVTSPWGVDFSTTLSSDPGGWIRFFCAF